MCKVGPYLKILSNIVPLTISLKFAIVGYMQNPIKIKRNNTKRTAHSKQVSTTELAPVRHFPSQSVDHHPVSFPYSFYHNMYRVGKSDDMDVHVSPSPPNKPSRSLTKVDDVKHFE